MLAVFVGGAFVDILEIDAAQYASISLEMLQSGSYLKVYCRAEDYLDKPPFLFWVSALSMKIFGVSGWAYKLPSILAGGHAIFSTFKLAEQLYDAEVGRTASLILGTSLAMIMMNNDIKTDTILTASTVFSIWMLVSYMDTRSWAHLIGAAIGIGISLLTKGPIGIMMPALAIGGHLIIKQQWQRIFDPRWAVLLLMVGAMLIPMCIGLYRQFGTEGLKFFSWTQSFGRITGESTWRNDTTVFFFVHVFLWSFLPWSLLALAALAKRFTRLGADLKNPSSEFYTLSGIILVGIGLSLSRFKLPHYIFIVFPLVAIITARYVHQLSTHVTWARLQLATTSITLILLAVLLPYCFPNGGYVSVVILAVGLVATLVSFFMLYRHMQTVLPSVIGFMAIGLALNLHFYPEVLKYQANSVVGRWVTERHVEHDRFISFATGGYALDFYAQRTVPWKPDAQRSIAAIREGTIVYADSDRYNDLIRFGSVPDSSLAFTNFKVQNLTLEFLNPATRQDVTGIRYLLFY